MNISINIFINNSKSLLNDIINQSKDIEELNTSITKISDSYSIIDNLSISNDNNDIEYFEKIINFGDSYFRAINDYLSNLKAIMNQSNDMRDIIKRFDFGAKLISLQNEYTKLLENITNQSKLQLEEILVQIKNNKSSSPISEALDDKEVVDGIKGIFKDNLSHTRTIENVGIDFKYKDQNRTINDSFSTSERISLIINKSFDILGDYVNKGIDQMGIISSNLFLKMGKGIEEGAYCIDVINKKGFDGFLDDPRCMDAVKYAIIYSVIVYALWRIFKYILKKITAITSWISGYEGERKK